MLLIIFTLCSTPSFALIVADNDIKAGTFGDDTPAFISQFKALPTSKVNLEIAMGLTCA
jgi:hypothetical protein